jgi:hypothetical protein
MLVTFVGTLVVTMYIYTYWAFFIIWAFINLDIFSLNKYIYLLKMITFSTKNSQVLNFTKHLFATFRAICDFFSLDQLVTLLIV